MIRKFASDRRGNFAMMMTIAVIPIMGGLALAVDYTELSRQRQVTLNALDAAGVATARYIVNGGVSTADPVAYETAIKKYSQDFFEANLGTVDPSKTALSIVLPSNNTGGGTLKLTAELKYEPYFLPTFAALIGRSTSPTEMDIEARSEVRLKNTLEVALVLDNSGSMSENGSGTGQQRMELLKEAATQLVDTLAKQAALMKQVEKPVQFGLVPFAASVNISPTNANAGWMDVDGLSPVHHENFDWTTVSAADKYAEFTGGAWYKRGDEWGESEDATLTRFSLYMDTQKVVSREFVETSREWVCKEKNKKGKCITYGWNIEGYNVDTPGPFATWQGCVEARPAPYNRNDVTPSSDNPATLFVPMFGPDEPGDNWATASDPNPDNHYAQNNWWNDGREASSTIADMQARQKNMAKYFDVRPFGASAPQQGKGPNYSCTTNPITPLQDVTTAEGELAITTAIDDMRPNGNTNVPEGAAWGWRVVSSGEPFTEGRPDSEKGNDKVIIVLTDGENTYGDLGSTDPAANKSTYAAYGFTGKGYDGTSTTRMFMETSDTIGKSNYTNSNYQAAMDEQLQATCTNAKAANVLVMTVSLDLDVGISTEKKAIDALTACASDSRFRKGPDGTPKKLYWNATGSNLAAKFKEIADELSNLRIVG